MIDARAQRLVLRLPANDRDPGDYLLTGQPGRADARGAIADLPAAPKPYAAIAIAPAPTVLLRLVGTPTRHRARLQQALPYLLEEQLGQAIEALFFALPRVLPKLEHEGQQHVPVAWVTRQRMRQWQTLLDDPRWRVKHLTPEAIAHPVEHGQWAILLETERVLIRRSRWQTTVCHPNDLDTVIHALLASTGPDSAPPAQIQVFKAAAVDSRNTHRTAQTLRAALPDAAVDIQAQPHCSLQTAARMPTPPLELRQGEFAAADAALSLKPWATAAGLALAILATQTVIAALDYRRNLAAAEHDRQQIVQLFAEALPGKRPVDPVFQLETAIAQARRQRADGAWLQWLNAASTALQPPLTVQQLNYRQQRLSLSLSATGNADTATLCRRIIADDPTIACRLGGVSRAGNRLNATLTLTASTAGASP